MLKVPCPLTSEQKLFFLLQEYYYFTAYFACEHLTMETLKYGPWKMCESAFISHLPQVFQIFDFAFMHVFKYSNICRPQIPHSELETYFAKLW